MHFFSIFSLLTQVFSQETTFNRSIYKKETTTVTNNYIIKTNNRAILDLQQLNLVKSGKTKNFYFYPIARRHRELSWEKNRKTKNRGCFLKQKRKNQTM